MTTHNLPLAVLNAVSQGIHVIRAYRDHLGYSVEDLAVTSGLSMQEIEMIEIGHRYEKGYRDRIARALGLPEGIFDEVSDIPSAA
ncbi:XRE family transcriptional regulator [Pseudaminobacter arsenicus]|uniref:XRE family transcriptional regulator n=1 Tax=Borborobacter arsenicus TaxID=1851146 RepID=A0A432V842_9HYPH|nr:helix-turn-helix transcriptional regulator [Pseudaminobacter arsenicus]RUM98300.1 XRE family transcriptional regulator [Pseudaminobacter arsenicus]